VEYNYDLKIFLRLLEGGNVFKDANKRPVTTRIDKNYIEASLTMVEEILGFRLNQWLGTTGKKDTSGDIDVAVDASKYDRKEIADRLRTWAKSKGLNPKDWVAMSGTNVHFKLPIRNERGEIIYNNLEPSYAQLDLMFGNPEFMSWSMRGEPGEYKGIHRHIIMASIAKAQGLKWSYLNGLLDRGTDKIISQNPDEIAKKLLPGATAKTLSSVGSILDFVYKKYKSDPQKIEQLLGEAAATLAEHYGVTLPMPNAPTVNESNDTDEYFLARLRDKILETESDFLFEGILLEGARIEHPEDLVFEEGSSGIIRAMQSLQSLSNDTKAVTIKWDGKPAIIYGRNEKGQFVLTDKSGFAAKGYDGRATSAKDIERIMSMRQGDRTELVALYAKLFPLLEKCIPTGFKGYVWADLLYGQKPAKKGDQWVFTPNTVTYSVDVNGELGKRIAQTEVGVAIHTYIDEKGSTHPVSHIVDSLNKVKSVLQVDPYFSDQPQVKVSSKYQTQIKAVLQYANEIDALLKPDTLRMLKITDLPKLMKRYINAKVSEGNFNNLASGFIKWLPSFTTDQKLERMEQHIKEHKQGLAAIFQSFVILTRAKTDIVNQLDRHGGSVQASVGGEKGHEGYVAGTDQGNIKLVDRMRFSRANFAKNA
jgi:hypothetical protein